MSIEDRVRADLSGGNWDGGPHAEAGDAAAATCAPELARALRLVQRLGDIPLPSAEVEAARLRVRARVFAAIIPIAR